MKELKIKLQNYELNSLMENGVLIKKVPFISKFGNIKFDMKIPIKVFPDNIDNYGNIFIRREGGRVRPARRKTDTNGIF